MRGFLDLDKDRQNHWPSLRLLEEEESDLVPELIFKVSEIWLLVSPLAFNDKSDSFSDLGQEFLVFLQVDESPGNNVGTAFNHTRFRIDQGDNYEHAVFG